MTSLDEMPPLEDVHEVAADLGFDALAALVHETAREKGFWPDKYYKYGTKDVPVARQPSTYVTRPAKEVTDEAIGLKLVLVHSEVTEILEAIRKNQGEAATLDEFSDVIIRLLDLYAALRNTGQLNDSLDDAVLAKVKKNSSRPRLHGNNF